MSDDTYQLTFTTPPYNPDVSPDGKVINLQCEALENSREYRELIFRQMQELGELTNEHALQRIRFIARRRRERAVS